MRLISLFIILSLIIIQVVSYLELQLNRIQLRDGLKNKKITCITKEVDEQLEKQQKNKKQQKKKAKKKQDEDDDQDDQDQDEDEQEIDDEQISESQNYKQICYEKDISYSLAVYFNKELNLISLDTTIPISWFKGQNCHLEASSKKCSKISTNLKDKIEKILKNKPAKVKHSSSQYAMIEGSSQLVKGIEEKGKDFKFITRDSSRLTNFIQLLALGFYMKGEKDLVQLENTNFINATEISTNLNYLCDGAISLRFDSMSENSFVNQLINYQKTTDRYITISTGSFKSFVALGQIAYKYSKNGYGGLEWIQIQEDQNYGKLPVITDIIIQNQNEQSSTHKFSQIRGKEYPAVVSLSASYIGIPKQVMDQWLKKFNKKSDCQINEETKYLQCKNLKQKEESKIITFQFSGKKMSFTLAELILGKVKGKTLINMKQTLHDTYAVLGEPLFSKFLIVFDYKNNKIGFGQKSDLADGQFINVVSIIRFVCFVFFFGCCFILCYLPIKRCIQVIKLKTKYGFSNENKGQTRRLKQYAPIQQNPYDQLSSKVKQALDQQNH